jgi:hypothetical protein
MRKTGLFLILIIVLGGWGCHKVIEQHFIQSATLPTLTAASGAKPGQYLEPCEQSDSYIPDTLHLDHFPMRDIRVNVHFMNSSDSTQNFNGPKGIQKAKDLIHAANVDLKTNDKLFLPLGNDFPALPTRYRLVLTPRPDDPDDNGVYFHYDDDLYYYVIKGKNDNRGDRSVMRKYGVQTDTVLNIFLLPHHPDSIASPNYQPHYSGVALSNFVKVSGWYENGVSEWMVRMVLNHEIGHILGLHHTWAFNDGCDDTPHHPKCWNFTDEPPCDSMVSNNVMDYNAYQSAWSPCQIGRVHRGFSKEGNRSRKFLEPHWCTYHPDKTIMIQDSIHWQGAKDLEGDITIARGGILKISCRISLPATARITVAPGGKLILDHCRIHNACGEEWEGILVQSSRFREGEVDFQGFPILENVLHPIEYQTVPN